MRLNVLWRVLGAQGLSSLGTSMSTIALAWMVLQLTGSVLHMGAVMAVSTFPLVITSWIGGALLDRFSSKHVMVLSDAARAVLIFSMPFVAKQAVGLIYVVAGLMGVCTAFFNPGQMKLIGELVSREQLVKANSYLSVSQNGAELFGYLAGGVLVAAAGYTPAFMADAGSYVLSALLLLGLPLVARRAGPPERLTTLITESPAVFGRIWRHPALRTNLLFGLLPAMVFAMGFPNAYALVIDVFGRTGREVGILEAAIGVGLILGGIIMSRMSLRGDKNEYVFFSFVAVAACFVGIYFSDFLWFSIGLMGVAGVANVGMFVPSITMFQEASGEGDKGRLISLRAGFGQMGATAGFLLGGVVGAELGILRVFLVAGLAATGFSLIIYTPYRVGAGRRAQAAWEAAMANGARRVAAKRAAREAAIGGAAGAWAMAAEEAAMEEEA
jgi:MFS family permease